MYKVLYRKYRPQFFADVVGQPQVTVTLKKRAHAGHFPRLSVHRLPRNGQDLLRQNSGPSGELPAPQRRDPCGECEICRAWRTALF